LALLAAVGFPFACGAGWVWEIIGWESTRAKRPKMQDRTRRIIPSLNGSSRSLDSLHLGRISGYNLRNALERADLSSHADLLTSIHRFWLTEFRAITAPDKHREDLIGVRLIEIKKTWDCRDCRLPKACLPPCRRPLPVPRYGLWIRLTLASSELVLVLEQGVELSKSP
jgi:hypothetical protein